jgi:hypothetical protein
MTATPGEQLPVAPPIHEPRLMSYWHRLSLSLVLTLILALAGSVAVHNLGLGVDGAVIGASAVLISLCSIAFIAKAPMRRQRRRARTGEICARCWGEIGDDAVSFNGLSLCRPCGEFVIGTTPMYGRADVRI